MIDKSQDPSFPGANRRRLLLGAAAGGAALAVARGALAKGAGDSKDVIADTTYGRVRGIQTPDGVRTFRGVPYGDTTAGANRFLPPSPPKPWAGVRDATAWGSKSPQVAASGQSETIMYLDYTEGGLGRQGEDCLVLNVWSKAGRDGGKRPVLVRIHGGGFTSGTGNHPMYWGHATASRGDAVFVSVNHRLGAVGFLDLSSIGGERYARSGNAGMLDLVLALQWVRDNIEAFGGDPDRVLVMGESGGGFKTSILLGMPAAKGLFHRAGIESGPGLTVSPKDRAARTAERFLANLGITGANFDDLQTLPLNRLLEAQQLTTSSRLFPKESVAGLGFGPVLDGDVIPRNMFEPTATTLSADIPIIVGYNQDEGTFIRQNDMDLYRLDKAGLRARVEASVGPASADMVLDTYERVMPNATPTERMVDIATATSFGRGSIVLAERKAALGKAPVYMYRFDYDTAGFNGKYGATHGAEITFINGDPSKMDVLTHDTPQARALAKKVNATWVAFAKTGDPNSGDLPKWPAYTAETRATMLINNESRVVNDPDSELRRMWAQLNVRGLGA